MTADDVLARLGQAAAQANVAEEACRRDFARRMDELARERAFAHRRLNLVREMLGCARAAQPPEGAAAAEFAAAAALAGARRELGWDDDTPARAAILEGLGPVARDIAALAHPTEGGRADRAEEGDLLAVLAAFERWYEAEHGASFWALFDVYVPERPVVDF